MNTPGAERGFRAAEPRYAKAVETEEHFLEAIRYIANNPSDPERWRYSSYGAMVGLRPQWSFVAERANVVPPAAGTTFG